MQTPEQFLSGVEITALMSQYHAAFLPQVVPITIAIKAIRRIDRALVERPAKLRISMVIGVFLDKR